MEIWKDIKEYEGIYKISNFGNIWSKHTNGVKDLNPSLSGYISVGLWKKNQRKTFSVHRLVAEHFLPNIENLPVVDHINGDRYNNKITNLRWASYSLNSKNQRKGGKHSVGDFIKYSDNELKNEIWVDATTRIKELQGKEFFQVSNLGRVKYYKKNNRWNTKSVQIISPKLQKRYPRCCIKNNGNSYDFTIHKLVAICFLREPNQNEVIDHIDSNICNPRLDNLQIISTQENNKKALRKDDSGFKNGRSVHNEKDILETLKLYFKNKHSLIEIAKKMNMHSTTVRRIVCGETYKKTFKKYMSNE